MKSAYIRDKKYIALANQISQKDESAVKRLLAGTALDLLEYKNGDLFALAIQINAVTILKILLDYFIENELGAYEKGSNPYLALKKKFQETLVSIIEDTEVSEEIEHTLSLYVHVDNSRDSLTDSSSQDSQNESELSKHLINGNGIVGAGTGIASPSMFTESSLEYHNESWQKHLDNGVMSWLSQLPSAHDHQETDICGESSDSSWSSITE